MEALALVGRRHERIPVRTPQLDHPVNGAGSELGPVGEHDDCRLNLRPERAKPAAKRCASPRLPVRAPHRPRIGLDVVGPENHDDVVDGARADTLEHGWKEDALFRGAEPGRGAGGEDDGCDQEVCTVILSITTARVGFCVSGSPS
jgi:hypothetical protein